MLLHRIRPLRHPPIYILSRVAVSLCACLLSTFFVDLTANERVELARAYISQYALYLRMHTTARQDRSTAFFMHLVWAFTIIRMMWRISLITTQRYQLSQDFASQSSPFSHYRLLCHGHMSSTSIPWLIP